MHFEWDEAKAEANLTKHAVSFDEALTCFYDPGQVVFYDLSIATTNIASSCSGIRAKDGC